MGDQRRLWIVGGAVVGLLVVCGLVIAGVVALVGGSDADSSASVASQTCDDVDATIEGTDQADRLTGTDGDDVIVAGDGDDVIWGLGGDDIICAGEGADVLSGGPGDDQLYGETDLLAASQVRPFGDRLVGGPGDDLLDGGTDPRAAGQSFDILDYRDSESPVAIDLTDLRAVGKAIGTDRLKAANGYTVYGSDYDDTILGSAGPDHVLAGGGRDKVRTRGGNDTVNTQWDQRNPGAQAPIDKAADLVWLSTGRDSFVGDGGRDFVDGGGGNDAISTRADVTAPVQVRGGVGDDRLTTFSLPDGTVYDAGQGLDTLDIRQTKGAAEAQRLLVDLRRGLWELNTGTGPQISGRVLGVEDLDTDVRVALLEVIGSNADEQFVNSGEVGRIRASLGGGDDVIDGGAGDDHLDGGAGKDTVRGKGGKDLCLGVEDSGSCESENPGR